jgi:hypothetical protein
MSDSLTLDPSPVPDEKQVKATPRTGLRAMFSAAMESLVAAQRQRFDEQEQYVLRYPPL